MDEVIAEIKRQRKAEERRKMRDVREQLSAKYDKQIGERLLELQRENPEWKLAELQRALGSKDYYTLMGAISRARGVKPKTRTKQPKTRTKQRTADKDSRAGLFEHLLIDWEKGRITAIDVPAELWTPDIARDRADLAPDPQQLYNGWANFNRENYRVRNRSEPLSPLFGEMIHENGLLNPARLAALAPVPVPVPESTEILEGAE